MNNTRTLIEVAGGRKHRLADSTVSPGNPRYDASHPLHGPSAMGLFSGKRPRELGVRDGRVRLPPSTPNAVSSQATGGYHQIAPIVYTGTREAALAFLKSVIGNSQRTRVVTATADYVYAEYQSRWLGYVDDVEFYFPANEKLIHVRSASRLGTSDFGVNRRRIESIRRQFLRQET